MNIAVGLFGIHYLNNLNHWMGWFHTVDYRKTYHNQFNYIYANHNVKYYSATYYSDIKNELMNDYKFTSVTFKEIDNTTTSNPVVKRNKIFKDTVKLMLDDKTEWELAILTRYDLNFKHYFLNLDIDFNNVNFLCGAKCGPDTDLVDDNFYCIHRPLLKGFYDTIEAIPETISAHQYHKWFENYNFMCEGSWYSHEMPYYNIVRIPNH